MNATHGMGNLERLIQLQAIHGEKHWLRGFGFDHETYVRGPDGRWRFSCRRLERTHAETSPGASSLAVDTSGDNHTVGATE